MDLTIPSHWTKPLTYTYRYSLPHSGTAFTGRAAIDKLTKQRLNDYDSRFELIEVGPNIVAYRVKYYGATPGQDYLVKQFVLKAPPGPWLVNTLTKSDQWKRYGTPEDATKQFFKDVDELESKREFAREVRRMDTVERVAKEMMKYGVRGCRHHLVNRTKV